MKLEMKWEAIANECFMLLILYTLPHKSNKSHGDTKTIKSFFPFILSYLLSFFLPFCLSSSLAHSHTQIFEMQSSIHNLSAIHRCRVIFRYDVVSPHISQTFSHRKPFKTDIRYTTILGCAWHMCNFKTKNCLLCKKYIAKGKKQTKRIKKTTIFCNFSHIDRQTRKFVTIQSGKCKTSMHGNRNG